jgi:hypothetical protein
VKKRPKVVARLDHRAVARDIGHRDSASIFCAREIRGTMSIAITFAPLDFASSISASFWPG